MLTSMVPPTSVTTEGAITTRDKLRERERRSRARRSANFERMRNTKSALERVELVLRTLNDDDAVWDDFLDEDSIRIRRWMRQSIALTNELRNLTSERAQLQRLLREHELASQTIKCMVGHHTSNDWDWCVQHWQELTRRNYRPWTLEECEDEMAVALKELHAFQWSTDKHTSGINFMGWREERRVDQLRGTFQCQFYKTFHGHDMMDYVYGGWDAYTSESVFQEVIVGSQKHSSLEVLQQLRPSIVLIRRTERYASIDVDAHAVYLVFRIKTARGFTQCVRTIRCPELTKVTNGPRDKWPSNFVWLQWEQLYGERGYNVCIGGSIGEVDNVCGHAWMFRALGSILRGEQKATGRKLIANDWI